MHTLIVAHEGTVVATLHPAPDDDELVSERRWRAALRPAIVLLKLAGDGSMCVPHRPGALAP